MIATLSGVAWSIIAYTNNPVDMHKLTMHQSHIAFSI